MSKPTVRCKFRCDSMEKTRGWNRNEFVWSYKLSAVTDGSAENKAFWAATPGGQMSVCSVKHDHFEVGKEYYIDITDATAEPNAVTPAAPATP